MITVSVVYDNAVERVYVFTEQQVKLAEECFLHNCKTSLTNWDEHTEDEITDMLDSGIAYDDERSVCITHMTSYGELMTAGAALWISSAAFTIRCALNWLYQALFPPEEKTEDNVEEK